MRRSPAGNVGLVLQPRFKWSKLRADLAARLSRIAQSNLSQQILVVIIRELTRGEIGHITMASDWNGAKGLTHPAPRDRTE